MKASIKRFYVSEGIFVVLLLTTGLVFRRVPPTEQFYVLGVLGVLLSFLTVALARIPKEDFQSRDGTGPFRQVARFVFTSIFGLAALLCFGAFVLALWIRISRAH